MNDVLSLDPRTGEVIEKVTQESSADEVDVLCRAAAQAATGLEALGRLGRARLLRHLADSLEREKRSIVALADRETALGVPRLEGELGRTCFQLRLFAEVLDEGSYLEAAIDHAGPSGMGPRPDLRRMLVPVGPVAVFGASNFPLAFSVPGGDTASALAAGCPVLVKAHPSHPATSQLCAEILSQAASGTAPEGSISVVHGLDAGTALVSHPAIRAVGYTGSAAGGQALLSIINERADPIPFFGELSSLNPVVVTPAAAEERHIQLARDLVGSFTLGAGQFCTKPGVILVPQGAAGDALVSEMVAAVTDLEQQWLLNAGISVAFERETRRLEESPGVQLLAEGKPVGEERGFHALPQLFAADSSSLAAAVTQECFGPVTVVVRYSGEDEMLSMLGSVPPSLTATILRGNGEIELPQRLSGWLRDRAGRLVYDAYPTGVAVSWAQHHGGPWPSTNSQHTSVGTSAVRRFLRPVTWQGAPQELLPTELRDGYRDIPRRINGVMELPG